MSSTAPVTRADVFGTFRPWLDAQGFTAPRISATDALCDRLGLAPANDAGGVNDNVPIAAPVVQLAAETSAIAMISAALLKIACPENSLGELEAWVDPIKRSCRRFGIDTMREVAAFTSQGGHESRGFTQLEEGLNYRAERLCEVWPKRFPTIAFASQYARNPEKLANFTYANRLGNGPPESGDGWRHRGFGIFQLTGKRNQAAFAEDYGIPLADVPAFIRTKEGAAMSAGWFWLENGLDREAATPGVEDETRKINGGTHGLEDRRRRFDAVIAAMLRLEQGQAI